MGFLLFMKKGSFFLPGVMWAKFRGLGFSGLVLAGICHMCEAGQPGIMLSSILFGDTMVPNIE